MSDLDGYTLEALYRMADSVGDRLASAELDGLESDPRYERLCLRMDAIEDAIGRKE